MKDKQHRALLRSDPTDSWRLRKTVIAFAASCALASILSSCDRGGETAKSRTGADIDRPALAVNSVEDLDRLMAPGAPTSEIIARFGKPQDTAELGQNIVEWRYSVKPLPAHGGMSGTYVFGVRLEITNGHVARLTHDFMGVPSGAGGKPLSTAREADGIGSSPTTPEQRPTLRLFVVSREPVSRGRFIDTDRFPKLGYVDNNPDATFTKLSAVTVEELKRPEPAGTPFTIWSFGIKLNPDDAKRLATLTSTNVSKRVLIMVGDEVVAAPVISAPLENGSFVMEFSDGPQVQAIKKQLAEMERQGRY